MDLSTSSTCFPLTRLLLGAMLTRARQEGNKQLSSTHVCLGKQACLLLAFSRLFLTYPLSPDALAVTVYGGNPYIPCYVRFLLQDVQEINKTYRLGSVVSQSSVVNSHIHTQRH